MIATVLFFWPSFCCVFKVGCNYRNWQTFFIWKSLLLYLQKRTERNGIQPISLLVRYLLLWRGMRMKYIFISRTTKKVVKEWHLYSGWDSKSMKKYAIYKIIFLLFHIHPKTSFFIFSFWFWSSYMSYFDCLLLPYYRMPILKHSSSTKVGRS